MNKSHTQKLNKSQQIQNKVIIMACQKQPLWNATSQAIWCSILKLANLLSIYLSPPDDIQEAYNLIKDLVPTTPQVIMQPHSCTLLQQLQRGQSDEHW